MPAITLFPVVNRCAKRLIPPFARSCPPLKPFQLLSVAVFVGVSALAVPDLARGEEGRPIVTSFAGQDSGGGSESSWVTAEDENGILYFGCDGVLVFDGERWSKFAVPGSYAVRSLAFGPNHRLWVGAVNEVGYFDVTEKGLSPYHSLVDQLPRSAREFGDVWQATADGAGVVFVSSTSTMVWDGEQFRVFSMPGARRLQCMRAGNKI